MIRRFPRNAVMQRGIFIAEVMIFVFGSLGVNGQKCSAVVSWFLISVKFCILFSTKPVPFSLIKSLFCTFEAFQEISSLLKYSLASRDSSRLCYCLRLMTTFRSMCFPLNKRIETQLLNCDKWLFISRVSERKQTLTKKDLQA